MQPVKLVTILLLGLSPQLLADDGSIGMSIEVSVSGIFKPRLTQAIIAEIIESSAAQEAGLRQGDKILAIDGCEIPGCPASKAKKLMSRKAGERLPLLIMDGDGKIIPVELIVK